MESVIGICGKDFVVMAANANVTRSALIMNKEQDRIAEMQETCMVGLCGDFGDASVFGDSIKSSIALSEQRQNGTKLRTETAASYIRKRLAASLRSRDAYQINLLVAGCNEQDNKEPKLYWIDYLATKQQVEYAVHGHASFFCYSILDKNYRKDMDLNEVLFLLRLCLDELKTRFSISQGDFIIKIADSLGIRKLE